MLSQSFIDMAARLKERSDYIETFAAHVSHEMKTPLTSIQGAAELLRDDSRATGAMPDAQRRRFIDNIIADTRRVTILLQRLRDLARAEVAAGGSTLLAPIIDEVRSAYPALEIVLTDAVARPIAISAENLSILLSHLADNAVNHGAGRLELSAVAGAHDLQLVVQDDGAGISEPNRDRIFDAFFTTRREGGGTGMGLGIVRTILRVHGGGIELLPGDRGAAFKVTLPFA